MRILIFHGYLLGGTGSNVYNARLAAALTRAGHDVHLLCQERHPGDHAFIDAAGDWDRGALEVRELEGPSGAPEGRGRCVVYRPNIGGLLPVYVADRYEGIEARTFAACSEDEVARYIAANVAAVSEITELVDPEMALANHAIMGPVILARALGGRVPYVAKVHGSALEYAVKPEPERFLEPAREGLRGAVAVLVGSRHTAESLWAAVGEDLIERTRLGPPGVEVEDFEPREPGPAAAGLRALVPRLRAETGVAVPVDSEDASAFDRDAHVAADAIARLDPEQELLVAFVGKLIVSKGADLLLACWPLVLAQVPRARLVVVGFGAYREGSERLLVALAAGELEEARRIALAGRALELDSAPAKPLKHLLSFLDALQGDELASYLEASSSLTESVVLTGRLDHEELAELLPACEALVAPSTFPEAFGMVAAEAAACGVLPVVANHSGLAEVAAALAEAVPAQAAGWLTFDVGPGAVHELAACLTGWLTADPGVRSRTREGLVRTVRERWSWDGVASGLIAAAGGRLEGLQRP
jgi:glycosyltransferase involved in cell wall biosynthesis